MFDFELDIVCLKVRQRRMKLKLIFLSVLVISLVACDGLSFKKSSDKAPVKVEGTVSVDGSGVTGGEAVLPNIAPPKINYGIVGTLILRRNRAMSVIKPSNTGDEITGCKITSLNAPSWLLISKTTCELSGTPPSRADEIILEITASNTGGVHVVNIAIRVRNPSSSSEPTIAARSIVSSRGHSCAIKSNKTVSCWGADYASQLGDGNGDDNSERTPALVLDSSTGEALTNVEELAVTTYSTCARIAGGAVKCWGGNDEGQLGDNSTTARSSAVSVLINASDPLTDITSLGGGSAYSETFFAVNSSGALYAWGNNSYGQAIVGSTTSVSVATAVAALDGSTDATTVAVIDSDGFPIPPFFGGDPAHMFTCAGMADGSLRCWGNNYHGQFGNGSTSGTNSTEHEIISGVTGVIDICAGSYHTCIVVNGGVKCAGKNDLGQLGDGTTTASTTFVEAIAEGSGVERVTCGFRRACARHDGGGIKCWGDSIYGQLGDGGAATTVSDPTPAPQNVVLGSGVRSYRIGGGINHMCAVVGTDLAKCWGHNGNGQLGNGTTTNSAVPVSVSF